MNENIFDKRRLKTFSNCKDLVRSMVGTRDGVIVYNEKFRLDLENTCYKASICEDLQKELEQLKEIEKEHQRINGDLRVEIKELKEQLEEADLELQLLDMITDENIKYKNQQKEFIKYMNDISEDLETEDVYDEEMKGYLIQRIDTFKEILQKYRSIIGDKE